MSICIKLSDVVCTFVCIYESDRETKGEKRLFFANEHRFFFSLSLCTFSVLLFCFLIKKKSEQIKKKTETCHNSFVFLFKNIFSTNKTYFNDKSCTTSDKYADTFRFHSATDFIRSASISFVDNRFTKSINQSHIYSQC